MSVQLIKEVKDSGVSGDYWVLVAIAVHRQGASNDFSLSGTYKLWKDATAYNAAKQAIRGENVQVNTGVMDGNPTVANMQTALDNAVIAEGALLEGGVVV